MQPLYCLVLALKDTASADEHFTLPDKIWRSILVDAATSKWRCSDSNLALVSFLSKIQGTFQ